MNQEMIIGASSIDQSKFYSDIENFQKKLDDLRSEGTNKAIALKAEIDKVKKQKDLSKEEKEVLIKKDRELLEQAKRVKEETKEEVRTLQTEAVTFTKDFYGQVNPIAKGIWKDEIAKIKADNKAKMAEIEATYKQNKEALEAKKPADKSNKEAMVEYENESKTIASNYKQARFEEITSYKAALQKVKNQKHAQFLQEYHTLGALRNGKNTIVENIENKAENYAYQFDLKNWLIKNGLYLTLFLFMIVCIIIEPSVLSMNSIMQILQNFSYKVFYALGVAGLILLGGTDLSVGRMVTLGTLLTCIILNPDTTVTFFGIQLSSIYTNLGLGGAVACALGLSVIFCTLFSAIAGFFSAKFKIHPFISTLATSLTIWGLCAVGTNTLKTGAITSEASTIGMYLFSSGSGRNLFVGFPITFIYAAVTIVIVSLIWNKTKFGKNLYAVGGNQEAASVSGISVFWVTMGAFIMAGVLYGLGGFVTGVVGGSSDSSYGQGWEMEAIAACVVGGISFLGGIGKVSGAVIGCIIFEMLKFFLNRILTVNQIGNPSDIANIFIGVIILIAVVFDSLKYLKKK